MRTFVTAAAVAALASSAAFACDDHEGDCGIEDWTYIYSSSIEAIQIDGVATCDSGEIMLRLYDGTGDSRKFIGVERANIEGHIFQAYKLPVAEPAALSIKFSIDAE